MRNFRFLAMIGAAAAAVAAMIPDMPPGGSGYQGPLDKFVPKNNRRGKGHNNRRGKGKSAPPRSRPNLRTVSKRVRRKHRRARAV